MTINGGSSSIKFAMYKMAKNPGRILSGSINRIGIHKPVFSVIDHLDNKNKNLEIDAAGFDEAASFLINWLQGQSHFGQVTCVGHRIVHGMGRTSSEIISDELLEQLDKISGYDPDHLPAEIKMVQLFKTKFPDLPQVACFDTAFHASMPRVAQILPIPRRFDEAGIRRYGFHGLSYAYLMKALKDIEGKEKANRRIVLAHLGNGASLAAVSNGKCLDTSMGFTPAGGTVMGTRCGDLDPGVAWYMMQSEKMTPQQFNNVINHESGLLGISETTANMQDLLQNESTDVRAAEAVALFCYQAKKWIGAFAAALGGLDILVFSGGIGENAPTIRSRICDGLQYLGIELATAKNNENAPLVSRKKSDVTVRVIPTDEELMIARDTRRLYNQSKNIRQ